MGTPTVYTTPITLESTSIKQKSSTPYGYLTQGRVGLTPVRQRLEQQRKKLLDDETCTPKETSPTLQKLRMTPGRVNMDRSALIEKHQDARSNADRLSVGGGVSLWPDMEDMRLSQSEVLQLALGCCFLFSCVIFLFTQLHGDVIRNLSKFYQRLISFNSQHQINVNLDKNKVKTSVIVWHVDHKKLLDDIHACFDVSKFPMTYLMYIAVYGIGMGTLVFFLADNVWSKSKLSPRRIKQWTGLLVAIGTWTAALTYMLISAYIIEVAIQTNIRKITEVLGEAIGTDLELDVLQAVVEYWRTRCVTTGTLTVMGVVEIRDVLFYLQYYLVPVITILGTPVVKLVVSLYHIYSVG